MANIEGHWEGEGLEEKYICKYTGRVLVKVNPNFYRPAEVDLLLGNPEEAKEALGWNPNISFDKLVKRMVEWDIDNGKTPDKTE